MSDANTVPALNQRQVVLIEETLCQMAIAGEPPANINKAREALVAGFIALKALSGS